MIERSSNLRVGKVELVGVNEEEIRSGGDVEQNEERGGES